MSSTQVRVCLVSLPGPVCDATYDTVTSNAHVTHADVAYGALSATRVLECVSPDLVVVDANMPDDEVHSLLQWIRDHDVRARTLVATLTSGQTRQALDSGAGAAVQRNILPARFAEIVEEIVETKQSLELDQ